MSKEMVLEQVKAEQRILTYSTQRQLKFFGHMTREKSLERLVLEG